MPDYKAPLREIKFVMDELLDMPSHYASIPAYAETATPEMVDAIIAEGARFCEQELAPLNRVGDTEGCVRNEEDGSVKTPTGFKEAYAKFVEGGWPSLAHEEEWGGQGLPESLPGPSPSTRPRRRSPPRRPAPPVRPGCPGPAPGWPKPGPRPRPGRTQAGPDPGPVWGRPRPPAPCFAETPFEQDGPSWCPVAVSFW